MIAKASIEDLIRSNEMSISYAFAKLANADPVYLNGEEFVDLDNPDLKATQMFHRHFFGDRLGITLGPIVRTHNDRYNYTRPLYKGRPGYFDLRESGNRLVIEPHEMLSLSSNERIRLGPKLGAFVIPRLRNVDAGLLYVPSYIDPYWDGILQAVIVNLSDHRQHLDLCEGVAICRFYKVAGQVERDLSTRFPQKSHHFGQSWRKILEEDAEPFPIRKRPITRRNRVFVAVREFFAEHNRLLARLGYTGGLIALIGAATVLWTRAERAADLEDELDTVQRDVDTMKRSDLPGLQRAVDSVSAQIPRSGRVTVRFEPGQAVTTNTFSVPRPRTSTTTAWAALAEYRTGIFVRRATFRPDPTDNSRVFFTVDAERQRTDEAESVDIQWMLAD